MQRLLWARKRTLTVIVYLVIERYVERMTELEKWYEANRLRVGKRGIDLSPSPNQKLEFIDGELGRFMFRFIDRGFSGADIEIIDHESGETIPHNLITSIDQII